jgi:hypothetical protein
MRIDDLIVSNLTSPEQVELIREVISDITGAQLVEADLDTRVIVFAIQEDLDDVDLTTVQCALREHGFEAGEVIEGQTCRVRFQKR